MASPLQQLAGFSSSPSSISESASASIVHHFSEDGAKDASGSLGGEPSMSSLTPTEPLTPPNAINIAIRANNGDCVNHMLNAVLDGKVRGGI